MPPTSSHDPGTPHDPSSGVGGPPSRSPLTFTPAEKLESLGLVYQQPSLRASDISTAIGNPFAYFLRAGLRLRPLLPRNGPDVDPLEDGTWYHLANELDDYSVADRYPDFAHARYLERLEEAQLSLSSKCAAGGITGAHQLAILESQRKSALSALAWYTSARQLPLKDGLNIAAYFSQPNFITLARELRLSTTIVLNGEKHTINCRLDLLLFNKRSNRLWIVDAKTTSLDLHQRLSYCKFESQPRVHMLIVRALLADGTLQATFSLPAKTELGGFIHHGILKPGIRLSGEDRDFSISTRTPTRGKNAGQEIVEREYFGEPKLSNYTQRVHEWMTATGRYEHLAPQRAPAVKPVVAFSALSATELDRPPASSRFMSRLQNLARWASAGPDPSRYPFNEKDSFFRGEISLFALLDCSPLSSWPTLLTKHLFISLPPTSQQPDYSEEEPQETDE